MIRGPSSASHVQDLIKMSKTLDAKMIRVHLIEGGWKAWKREHSDLVEIDTQE